MGYWLKAGWGMAAHRVWTWRGLPRRGMASSWGMVSLLSFSNHKALGLLFRVIPPRILLKTPQGVGSLRNHNSRRRCDGSVGNGAWWASLETWVPFPEPTQRGEDRAYSTGCPLTSHVWHSTWKDEQTHAHTQFKWHQGVLRMQTLC